MPNPGPTWSVSPRDWHALENYDQWGDPQTTRTSIALHHGGGSDYRAHRTPYNTADEIQQLQQWEGFHIYSRGWRGIAYNWGLGQTGTVYRLRGWNTAGAHTGDIDNDGISNNREILSVIFIGSGNHARLSPAAQSSLVRLRRYIEAEAPQAQLLRGHQEISLTTGGRPKTSCPGPFGMEYVRAHRQLEETDMSQHGPESWDGADFAALEQWVLGGKAVSPPGGNSAVQLATLGALIGRSGRSISDVLWAVYSRDFDNLATDDDLDVLAAELREKLPDDLLDRLHQKLSPGPQ